MWGALELYSSHMAAVGYCLPPVTTLRTLTLTWLRAALAFQLCSCFELSQPFRVALAASTQLWILSPRLGPMHPFPFCFGALGGMPGLKCPWTGWEEWAGGGAAEELWPLGPMSGLLLFSGLKVSASPPPHSPSIADQQPMSDRETEEFPFGWDPDEGPLPVSDTLCYPKGLMFLPF